MSTLLSHFVQICTLNAPEKEPTLFIIFARNFVSKIIQTAKKNLPQIMTSLKSRRNLVATYRVSLKEIAFPMLQKMFQTYRKILLSRAKFLLVT